MMNLSPIFSNANYYKNKEFQRLMRLANEYDDYILNSQVIKNPEFMKSEYEKILDDFYSCALEWFESNRDSVLWRRELK